MGAYYNESDQYAAQWLRNLIAAGHIAAGDVDERVIRLVRADDLRGYTQCHFFAGIGVWSYALRLAGWPDDEPVWTGSCPCQGFSAAGRKRGFDDERHLWPHWARLILERGARPVFGEQVASSDGLAWLDFVCADMEGSGYAVGAVDLCAAGFGAPHVRQRLFFVADADEGRGRRDDEVEARPESAGRARERRGADFLGHAEGDGRIEGRAESAWQQGRHLHAGASSDGFMGDAGHEGQQGGEQRAPRHGDRDGPEAHGPACESGGPLNGFWATAEWLPCIDGKARPVEPGTFPLAHGAPARVGRLRAYGNAIVAPVAAEFIRAYRKLKA